jgi:murein L,D-transpeptidase YafK
VITTEPGRPDPPSVPPPSVPRLGRRRWLGLAALVAGVGAVVLGLALTVIDWEGLQIDRERSRRRALAQAGTPLPGTPDLQAFDSRLKESGVALGAPVFIRIFKLEFEMELWMKRGDRFELFATYPICRWSGALGPKLYEGDRQAPEGVYTVDWSALNPNSRWHRAFNLGFPNALDRTYGRTGSYLMVHGGCGSIGCYAMTDAVIDEIWRLVTAALKGGQARFHVHIFPFRMTEERMSERSRPRWATFWRDLKLAYDAFEATRLPPKVSVCEGRYMIAPDAPATAGSSPLAGC